MIIPCIFFHNIINEVDRAKNVEGVEIYENKNGDIIIPSLEYLANPRVLAIFGKIPIKAKVESKADFGIFLSFYNGKVNKGLLHNSEIRKVNLTSNDSQLNMGNSIDVYIQNVNPITEKISFALRQATSNHQPLKNESNILYNELKKLEGSIVEGKVTSIKEYGVFVEIYERTTGLINQEYSITK